MEALDQEHLATTQSDEIGVRSRYLALDGLIFIRALYDRWIAILGWTFLVTAVSIVISLEMRPGYVSTLRFMPPQTSSSPLLSLVGGGRSGGSAEHYRSLLSSRTVFDDVIEHQNLLSMWHMKSMELARIQLSHMAIFDIDKDNFVTIGVGAGSPKDALDIANEFFAALTRLTEKISRDEAQHHLAYITSYLDVERSALSAAEDRLLEVQKRTGLISPDAQTNLGLQEVAQLTQRIVDLNSQLAVARSGSTDQNPQIIRLRSQIASLQSEVQQLQSKSEQANAPSRVPSLALDVLRATRDVRYHTAVLELLTKGVDNSRTEESYTPSLALVDPAIMAEHRTSPRRKVFAGVGFVLGLTSGVFGVLFITAIRLWRRSPMSAMLFSELRRRWNLPLNTDKSANAL